MKFSALKVNTYFKLEGSSASYQKVSPFGYKDQENIVLGEIQILGDPEVLLPLAAVKPTKTKKSKA